MSGSETYELAVRLRGEGIDETERDLEGVEDTFDDTADSIGDSAGEMEGFSQQFKGVMGAIITGLAVAVTGLLSMVPVVGESVAGLGAVIDALAFQLDNTLRPGFNDFTDTLFDVSAEVFEAESFLEGLAIALRGVTEAVLDLGTAPVENFLRSLLGLEEGETVLHDILIPAFHDAVAAIRDIDWAGLGMDILTFVVGGVVVMGSRLVTRAAAIARSVFDRIRNVNWVQLGKDVLQFIIDGALSLASAWVSTAFVLAIRAKNQFFEIDWLRLGKDIVNDIIDGLKSRLSALKSAAEQLALAIESHLPESRADAGPFSKISPREIGMGIADDLGAGIRHSLPSVQSAASGMAGAAAETPPFAAGRREEVAVFLDGRRVNENQGRYQAGGVDLRGR